VSREEKQGGLEEFPRVLGNSSVLPH